MPETPLFLAAETIHARVHALAADLDRGGSESMHLVGVLKGAVMFLADLARAMTTPVTIDFITMSTYEGVQQAGPPRLLHDVRIPLHGRDVILVEDIVDSGRTLRFLQEHLGARSPQRLRTVTLLDKPSRRVVDAAADYIGFSIPDRFVIGYGLDFEERYRHLPYITELAAEEPQRGG
jgi:hypoxanthine phosphoribosyltransferase